MTDLTKKAKDYFRIAEISENLKMLDVACSNYFKSLSALNDFVLSKKDKIPKDHHQRFSMLKQLEPFLHKIPVSLFLTYRRAYAKEINSKEIINLKNKIKEAFKYAGINIPTANETKKNTKKTN